MLAALLWAVLVWGAAALPARAARRFVPAPFTPYAILAASFLAGGLAAAWAPGEGLLRQTLAATAALVGLMYPPGVAPGSRRVALAGAAGGLLVVSPLAVPLWALLWGIGYVASGYPAAGRGIATLGTPILVGLFAGWPLGAVVGPASLLLLDADRADLRRVMLGTERKHGWRPEA